MPSRRVLRSVLWNLLGTYTSRYSSYDGYWLFGFLVRKREDAEFDLLAEPENRDDVVASAHMLAVREFADQLAKAGLDQSRVSAARLHIERLTASNKAINLRPRDGWDYRFRVRATTDTGRTYECETVIFVAPHDPKLEQQSLRGGGWLRPPAPRASGRLDE